MLKYILNLISDNICLFCQKEITNNNSLCDNCYIKLKTILSNYNRCPKCSLDLNNQNQSLSFCYCSNKNFNFENNFSCLPFNELYHNSFIDAKYHQKWIKAKFFIDLAISHIPHEKLEFYKSNIDYIVVVPISLKKLMKRGYSITGIFAKEVSKIINKSILNIFSEKGYSYLHLNKNRNKQNLSNKYHLKKSIFKNYISQLTKIKKQITNKNILLIDDIFTTGITVDYIANQLKSLGCNKIYILTMLRTQFKLN